VAIKQPAAVAVIAGALWVAFVRRRALGRYFSFAALPFAACAAAYAIAGSLRDFVLWTVVVPIRDYGGRTGLPINAAQAPWVILGFLPLAAFLLLRPRGESAERSSTALLALMTLGFASMAVPKFELVRLIPSVPLLAVGAGGLIDPVRRGAGATRFAAALPAAVIVLDALFVATDTSGGQISFWSSRGDDAIVERLRRLPPAPLYLYGADQNIFIRSGRVPPGRLYANPDLWYQLRAEWLEQQQIATLKAHPETIVLAVPDSVQTGDAGTKLAAWISGRYLTAPSPRGPSPGKP